MKIKYMENNNAPVYRIELEERECVFVCSEYTIERCKKLFLQKIEQIFDETVNAKFK